jgi:hypothetical protein
MLTYEAQLEADLEKGFREGSMHFDEQSAVHKSLRKITSRLKDLNIPYAVVGGMALFSHGVRRFTEDVDILLTPAGLKQTHDELEGLGYTPPFKGSKQLRDAETGVRIEFLVTGQFPGDGKPKPVSFPDPANVGIEMNGIQFLRLETLIELKLASGISNAGRLKDLADVQEIIRTLHLDRSYESKLDPYVRPKFLEMWDAVQTTPAEE